MGVEVKYVIVFKIYSFVVAYFDNEDWIKDRLPSLIFGKDMLSISSPWWLQDGVYSDVKIKVNDKMTIEINDNSIVDVNTR